MYKSILTLVLGLTSIGTTDAQAMQDTHKNKLLTIESDTDSDVSELSAIISSDGEVKGIQLENLEDESRPKVFSKQQLESRSGAVLLKKFGLNVIVLKGQIDDDRGRGTLEVRYLTNAPFSYSACLANAERRSGAWRVLNTRTGEAVEKLVVQAHDNGIKTIDGICN
jgi:hypothetical protein